MQPPELFKTTAELADISINGTRPWDVTVHDPDAYRRVLSQGSLGIGESYMDGLWDCQALDQFFDRLLRIEGIAATFSGQLLFRLAFHVVYQRLRSLRSYLSPSRLHEQHYTIGNDVFETMLDPTMSYSCAYWKNAKTLEQAQLNKLEMICQKLELKEGERLLDIGCGWGGLAEYAAKLYGVDVVGITLSKEQQQAAAKRCQGLSVEIKVMDYRNVKGKFDKIASINMFEHVGTKHYHTYFKKMSNLLNKHGLFFLQTTGLYKTMRPYDTWLNKHIFTKLESPSAVQIAQAVNNIFLIDTWHNMSPDYDRTLMAWAQQFDQNWHILKHRYDNRFYRMWKYYLLSCAGQFRSRKALLWQLVLSKRTK